MIGDTASLEKNIERKLDRIVAGEQGPEVMPYAYMDLDQALVLATKRVNELDANGESWDRIERVIKFADAVQELIDRKKAAEQPPPGAPPQGPPQGPPPQGAPPMPAAA